jgi:hypothetical protein
VELLLFMPSQLVVVVLGFQMLLFQTQEALAESLGVGL